MARVDLTPFGMGGVIGWHADDLIKELRSGDLNKKIILGVEAFEVCPERSTLELVAAWDETSLPYWHRRTPERKVQNSVKAAIAFVVSARSYPVSADAEIVFACWPAEIEAETKPNDDENPTQW